MLSQCQREKINPQPKRVRNNVVVSESDNAQYFALGYVVPIWKITHIFIFHLKHIYIYIIHFRRTTQSLYGTWQRRAVATDAYFKGWWEKSFFWLVVTAMFTLCWESKQKFILSMQRRWWWCAENVSLTMGWSTHPYTIINFLIHTYRYLGII